jgi:hypothetical protein
MEEDFSRRHYLHVCRNPACPKKGEPQGNRERGPLPLDNPLPPLIRIKKRIEYKGIE